MDIINAIGPFVNGQEQKNRPRAQDLLFSKPSDGEKAFYKTIKAASLNYTITDGRSNADQKNISKYGR